jgi:hypothetical protein
MDVFVRAIFEEIHSNQDDKAFFLILSRSEVQQKLHHIFGSMPDGQRNPCWETLLWGAPNFRKEELESSQSDVHVLALGSILAALGLSVPPYRAVPEELLVALLTQVTHSFGERVMLTIVRW